MPRKLRILAAALCLGLITLLFLDVTGTVQRHVGWLAKAQFLPALLAANLGVVISLLVVTLLFGRIYCSVLCPLGVFQDLVSWIAGRRQPSRFVPSPPRTLLRYGILGVFAILVILGVGSVFALLAPYSAYGRMVSTLLGPLYGMANNLLARLAARAGSYAISEVEIWLPGLWALGVALVTFLVVTVLAWRGGRTWCNTICPVGTFLGSFARFALLRPRIQEHTCNQCGHCARNCKASCMDSSKRQIDLSRCVLCFDCLEKCPTESITYARKERHAQNR